MHQVFSALIDAAIIADVDSRRRGPRRGVMLRPRDGGSILGAVTWRALQLSCALGLAALAAVSGLACRGDVAGGRADGPAVFAAVCAPCHGATGKPSRERVEQLGVRDLTDPAVQARLTDATLRSQIVNGSDNKRMPAFEGTLTEAQIEALVRHVRTLAAPAADPAGSAESSQPRLGPRRR